MTHTAKTVRAWAEASGKTIIPPAQFLDALVLTTEELWILRNLPYGPKLTRDGKIDANTTGFCVGWYSCHLFSSDQYMKWCPEFLKQKLDAIKSGIDVRSIDIMRMAPGGFIAPHTDDLGQGECTHHIYVSLDMPTGSGLAMADGVIDMPQFSVNVINSGKEHAAYNDSDEFRYILTIISKDGSIPSSYFPGVSHV